MDGRSCECGSRIYQLAHGCKLSHVSLFATPILYSCLQKHISRKPVKADGQPEDVASLVSYLASKEAHFITGMYIVRCNECSILTLSRAGQCVSLTFPFVYLVER